MKRKIIIALVTSLILFFLSVSIYAYLFRKKDSIKVGILHSLTGTMATSEKPVVDAALMAIQEINDSGGLLGCTIEPILVDGASNWNMFATEAEYLITQEQVDVIFGCWTSASRKEVKRVVEKYNNLLFYPVQYEGAELSPNIIYTGATPNQQILPGINWCYEHLGKSFYIIGSDYVYAHIASIIAKELISSLDDAKVVGEQYLVFGAKDFKKVVEDIKEKKPDVILNNINGDTNVYFFRELHEQGVTAENIPVMSFSIAESELEQMNLKRMSNNYATWSYFQTIDTQVNRSFVQKFKKKYGEDRVVSDSMEAAYFGVYLWSQAVFIAQSAKPEDVKKEIGNQSKRAPEGIVSIDGFNHHTWKLSRIGKINEHGQFDIQWSSGKAIYPVVYPYFTSEEWSNILNNLYQQWGGKWARE